jgi:hypothetical protein
MSTPSGAQRTLTRSLFVAIKRGNYPTLTNGVPGSSGWRMDIEIVNTYVFMLNSAYVTPSEHHIPL